MNTLEKLEQSSIVKEKGTQCFKVFVKNPRDFILDLNASCFLVMFSDPENLCYRMGNTSRRLYSTRR